jgi:hypothetical protein
MKKLLLQLVLLLLPFLAFAQNEAATLKDFSKKAKGIRDAFKLNEHVSVMSLDLDFEKFELVAIDDKMQVLWRTTLKGHWLGAGKFKGQILAIAAADYSFNKNLNSPPYTGYLVDELTGEATLEKIIYQSNAETREYPSLMLYNDDSQAALLIRRTAMSKARFTNTKGNETKDLTILNLDEKLNTSILKPKIPEGELINITNNKKGDIYAITRPDKKEIKVYRYEVGRTEPGEPIALNVELDQESIDFNYCEMHTANNNRKLLYFALAFGGKRSGIANTYEEIQIPLFKVNFEDHSVKTIKEVFDKAHVKAIENSYVPYDKKLDKPYIDRFYAPKDIIEGNGTLILVLGNKESSHTSEPRNDTGLSAVFENSLIINGYDTDLKPKFQQILPSFYRNSIALNAGYYENKNSLYIIANSASGPHIHNWHPYYGQLDLNTGNWLKLEKLPKGKLNDDYLADGNILWFPSGFIVPFCNMHYMSGNQETSLQLNTY